MEPICIICLEGGSLMDPSPCACKGTAGIHHACLIKLQETMLACPVCRHDYRTITDGTHTIVYSSGRKCVFNTVGGLRHGDFKEFDEVGVLLKSSVFDNGVLNGPYHIYHEDGKTHMIECTYVRGCKQGALYEYDEDGHIISIEHYKNDKKDGWCAEYYGPADGGGIFQEYYAVEGLKDGPFIEYDKYGLQVLKHIYKEGRIICTMHG